MDSQRIFFIKQSKMLNKLQAFAILIVLAAVIFKAKGCEFCRRKRLGVHLGPYFSAQENGEHYHGFTDLYPLVNKVSSEFRIVTISLVDGILAPRRNALVKAVAMTNARNSNNSNSKPLQVWIQIMEEIIENFQTSLSDFQKTLQDANNIHKATVTSIILFPDISKIIEGLTRKKLLLMRRFFPKSEFKLGFGFFTEICKFKSTNNTESNILNEVKRNLDLVDFIQLRWLSHADAVLPVDVEVTQLIDSLKTCSNILKENSSAENELMTSFTVGWSDTTKSGTIDYERFVQRWKLLTGALSSEKFTLMMFKAFDYPNDEPGLTFGWWRLRESSGYATSSQLEFDDKKTIAERESKKTSEFLLSHLKKEFVFDRERTIIRYSLLLSKVDGAIYIHHSSESRALLIATIATKFNTVLIHDVDYSSLPLGIINVTDTWVNEALDSVAHFNAHSDKHLDLVLGCACETLEDINMLINRVKRGCMSESYFIKNVVISNFDASILTYVKRELRTFGVKVGIMLPINTCIPLAKTTSESPLLQMELDEVDFFYFSYIPLNPFVPGYTIGVDRVVPQIISWFEVCKRQLNSIFPDKEIALETGYPDTFLSVKDDYVSFAMFWEQIHSWADRSNITILMFEAFDTIHYHHGYPMFMHMGWWKFLELIGIAKNDSLIAMEEKRILAVKYLEKSTPKTPQKDTQSTEATTIIVSAVLLTVLGLSLLVLLAIWKIRKSKRRKEFEERFGTKLSHPDVLSLPNSAFLPATSQIIGIGNFGTVYKCFMSQLQAVVAVKTISSDRELTDDCMGDGWKCLLSEIKIMCHVGKHENILQLLGVCQESFLYIVTEYCENGSLLSYLRSQCAQSVPPEMYDLLQYCIDIANGMQFLEEKNVIHGDLSARNVLLDGSKTCKLSDFGLSRKIYQQQGYIKHGTEPLPWRWMAPESLSRKEFTHKSDVWSMGVTFWEVFTLGEVPFPDMSWDDTFCDKLVNGMKLKQPQNCKENTYQLLLSCWEVVDSCRPDAGLVLESLKNIRGSEYTDL